MVTNTEVLVNLIIGDFINDFDHEKFYRSHIRNLIEADYELETLAFLYQFPGYFIRKVASLYAAVAIPNRIKKYINQLNKKYFEEIYINGGIAYIMNVIDRIKSAIEIANSEDLKKSLGADYVINDIVEVCIKCVFARAIEHLLKDFNNDEKLEEVFQEFHNKLRELTKIPDLLGIAKLSDISNDDLDIIRADKALIELDSSVREFPHIYPILDESYFEIEEEITREFQF